MEYRITKEELGNDRLYSTLIALDKCMAIWSEFGKVLTNELKERNEK